MGGAGPLAWAPLLILAAQASMFAVAASRGLDLTDESFYLLAFRHWSEWPSVSLFGAYLSLPFIALGESVWALRILGIVLLLGAGIWFSHEVTAALQALAGTQGREGVLAGALAGGAGIWSYYGAFPGPPTPSYNLLTLVCALLGVAFSLRLGRKVVAGDARELHRNALALGLVASVGIATKFSSGILVLALCVVIVAGLAGGRLDARSWARIGSLVAGAALLNIWLLWLADPDLPGRVRAGIEVTWAMYPRKPANELLELIAVEIPREILRSLRILMWPLLFAVVVLALARRTPRPSLAESITVVVFVAWAALLTFVRDNRVHRVVLLTLLAALVALAAMWLRRGSQSPPARGRRLVIGLSILAVPFAYSFGTNNPVLWHMGMAAVFPSVVAIALLRAMLLEQRIAGWAFALCAGLLTAVPAEFLVRQWFDARYTYRLGAPLAEQTAPLPSNPARIDLKVSPALARDVAEFLRLTRDSGYAAGQPMIDFTGQSPGLVALCQGVPLGAIWFIGGPGFEGDQVARISLENVDADALRRAWLLTSSDSFARIDAWRNILEARIGATTHAEAGRIRIADPTSSDKSKTIELTLWRPRS
jgi:hypothetical protein